MMTSVVEKSSNIMSGHQKHKGKCRSNKCPCRLECNQGLTTDAIFERSIQKLYGPQGVCQMCGDKSVHDGAKEKAGDGILDHVDWCDSARSELQSLVMCNLDAAFKIALKKIVASGYSEEVANMAVMSPGIFYGPKDTLSNIVDNTLKFLKTNNSTDLRDGDDGMDLKGLEDYLISEFIYVLRVIRPFSSPGDMLWYLLVSDLNVSDVRAAVFGRYDIQHVTNSNVSSHPLPKNQVDEAIGRLDMNLDPPLMRRMSSSATDSSSVPTLIESNETLKNPNMHSCEREGAQSTMNVVDMSFAVSRTSQRLDVKGKFSSSSNVRISDTTKGESNSGQKLLHVDKGFQTHGNTKSFVKQGKLFLLTTDKKTRSSGKCYPKNASMKTNKAMGVKISEDGSKSNGTPAKGNVSLTSSLCKRCVASSLCAGSGPISDTVSSPQMKRVSSHASSVAPLDISSRFHDDTKVIDANGRTTKPDQKTEMIFQLISTIYKLKDQLEQWAEWANSRVMQATLMLTKHKDELNILRQEKIDPEKLKQSIKESTLRKLSEIENSLFKVNEQVEHANCAVRNLEVKNSALKQATDAAKAETVESAANSHEISERERSAESNVKSLDKQKSLLHEELISLKQKQKHSQKEFIQAKGVLAQIEANKKHESKTKKDLQLKASSIKMTMEQAESLRKFKEDAFKTNAEVNLQKYKDKIQMLEREVAKFILSAEANKIASRAEGINGGRVSKVISLQKCPMLPDAQLSHMKKVAQKSHKKSSKAVKRDRECVMCMSEEISVVFLPCSHQAICAKCNELHEKNGIKDCPSCRSVIQHRIVARYHVPQSGI